MIVTLAGLLVFAFAGIGGNTHAGFLFVQSVEQRSLDMRFAARGQRPHDERIVIVGIDEKTLQKIGSFPLPRNILRNPGEPVECGGAAVIAFDATFPTPESNSAEQALSATAARARRHRLRQKSQRRSRTRGGQRSGRDICGRAEDSPAMWSSVICFLTRGRAQVLRSQAGGGLFQHRLGEVFPAGAEGQIQGARDFDMGQAWRSTGGGVRGRGGKYCEARRSCRFLWFFQHRSRCRRHAAARRC